jgi:WD40 repeat protein
MNPDGSGRLQLTSPDHLDRSPAWSPDGNQIAFTRGSNTSDCDVFVMDADGSNQRRITQFGKVFSYRPTWSPDGTKLAFVGRTAPGDYTEQVYVVNADGSGLLPIGPGREPAWSPDGSKLAFSFGYLDGGLYLMNPDGSGRTQITTIPNPVPNLNNYDWSPVWSPDGQRIVFIRTIGADLDGENWESQTVWAVNSDGSNPAKLADIETYYRLSWSPDGTKFLFSPNNKGDLFTMGADGSNITRITNTPGETEGSSSWQAVPLVPPGGNPIDDASFFVRQHYRDFLNREPDAAGLAFWTNEITSCGADPQCIEAKRINVSAAFFLSIEFQQTGYLVYRFYKSAFGNLPGAPVPVRLSDFLPDAQAIGQGVIVNQGNWQQQLETNKQNYANAFVQRLAFTSAYPTSMTPGTFVDTLFANAGVSPSSTDRNAAVAEFGSASSTADVAARARALRRVADNETLVQQEFNRAFVLMQYFGYLRRNPNDAPETGLNFDGYNFWLNKLNSFNGDFAQAEMVKAFINSAEYRQRFGP